MNYMRIPMPRASEGKPPAGACCFSSCFPFALGRGLVRVPFFGHADEARVLACSGKGGWYMVVPDLRHRSSFSSSSSSRPDGRVHWNTSSSYEQRAASMVLVVLVVLVAATLLFLLLLLTSIDSS